MLCNPIYVYSVRERLHIPPERSFFVHLKIKNMWITLFFVCTILLVSTKGSNDCVGYSVDKCAVEDGALIETIKDIDEENCQFYCNVIYGQNCTFYIYDKKQVVCEVFRSEMKDYIDSCKKYGGPPDPSVAQCLSSHNECKVCL